MFLGWTHRGLARGPFRALPWADFDTPVFSRSVRARSWTACCSFLRYFVCGSFPSTALPAFSKDSGRGPLVILCRPFQRLQRERRDVVLLQSTSRIVLPVSMPPKQLYPPSYPKRKLRWHAFPDQIDKIERERQRQRDRSGGARLPFRSRQI